MLDLVKTLSKGQVVRSPDIRPIDICLALAYARQEGKPLSMESQTAAIMSLWHLEVTGATRL